MKTSNKLLLIAFGIVLSGILYTVYEVKMAFDTALSESRVVNDDIKLTGNVSEVSYEIDEIEELAVSGSVKAKIIKSDVDKIVLKGDSVLFKYVEIKADNDRLSVVLTKIRGHKVSVDADIFISHLQLDEIVASDGAQLSAVDVLENSDLDIEANAGAFVNLDVRCKVIKCSSNAGAQVMINGVTDRLEGSANAGAFIKANGLNAKSVKASANAGGQIYVFVTERLDASSNAGGIITYSGQPAKVNKSTMVGGIVTNGD